MAENIGWAIIRDSIEIDDEFLAELLVDIDYRRKHGEQIAPGSTLAICARQVTVKSDLHVGSGSGLIENGTSLNGAPVKVDNVVVKLPGAYHLLIATERLDGEGKIITTGKRGSSPDPPAGRPRSRTAHVPGEEGLEGGAGGAGDPATNVTIYAKAVTRATVHAIGGIGGTGGLGGAGGDGFRQTHVGTDQGVLEGEGGQGGRGGPGGPGGPGGTVQVFHVEELGALDVQNKGGDAGTGGGGGRGGESASAPEPRPGVPGRARSGDLGGPGKAGLPEKTVFTAQKRDEAAFWAEVVTTLRQNAAPGTDLVKQWADYRARVARYFLRTFEPRDDQRKGNRQLALQQCEVARKLDPDAEDNGLRADVLASQIGENLNPLGLAYNYDVVPDFPHYEKVFTDYAGLVQDMFQLATDILVAESITEAHVVELESKIASIDGQLELLAVEQQRVEKKVDETKALADKAMQRQADLHLRMVAAQGELGAQKADRSHFGVDDLYEWGTLLVKTGVAVYTGYIVADAGLTVANRVNAGEARDMEHIEKFKETKEFKDMRGGIEKLAKPESASLIDQWQMMLQAQEFPAEAKLKALILEGTALHFEKAVADIRHAQSKLELEAAKLRIRNAKSDQERARKDKDNLGKDTRVRGEIARILMRRAQGYADIIMKYIFFAARAVDIYTAAVDEAEMASAKVAYDYGYIDPDEEADAFRRLDRGDGTQAAVLAQRYVESWSRLPDVIYHRDAYETYLLGGNLVRDVKFVRVDDPERVARFRSSGEIDFSIRRADLPPTRFEEKVDGVVVSLAGAASPHPGITCLVEHTGQWALTKRGREKPVVLVADSRQTPVLASKSIEQFEDSVFGPRPTTTMSFWGRGMSATWRVTLEPYEFGGVDLRGLQSIDVAFLYTSFLTPTLPPLGGAPRGVAKVATVLGASPMPSQFGESVLLTLTAAAETAGVGVPTGRVTFTEGGESLGSGELRDGRLDLPVANLSVGSHEIVASYEGDATFAPVQVHLTHLVTPVETTVLVAAEPNPARLRQPVTLAVIVVPRFAEAGTPPGRVAVREGTTKLAQMDLEGGRGEVRLQGLGVGEHDIVASYEGAARFAPSEATLRHTVTRMQTVTALTTFPNPSHVGQLVNVAGSVASLEPVEPSGFVTFSEDGTPLTALGELNYPTAAFTVGEHSLRAAYDGDEAFESSEASVAHSVQKIDTTTNVASSPNPSLFDVPVTLTADVVPAFPEMGLPKGTVEFRDGPTPLGAADLDAQGRAAITVRSLAVGAHQIEAAYLGNEIFNASVGTVTQVVERAPTKLEAQPGQLQIQLPLTVRLTNLRAKLTRPDTGAGLADQTVRFLVGTQQVCEAKTGPDGVASCGGEVSGVSVAVGSEYTAVFKGTESYGPSEAKAKLLALT